MGQIKAIPVNWLDLAWHIQMVISDMPEAPPAAKVDGFGISLLDPLKRESIEALQTTIALHLAYRLKTVHKFFYRRGGKPGRFMVETRDPIEFKAAYDQFVAWGLKLEKIDEWAILAHAILGTILRDHWVSNEWKSTLPLMVASISGLSSSRAASLNARRPRKRRNDLKQAKAEFLALNPDANWMQLLDLLEGEGVVTSWDAAKIQWTPDGDEIRTLATKTFRNWTVRRKPKFPG